MRGREGQTKGGDELVRRVDLVHCARKLNKPIRNKTPWIPSSLDFVPFKKKKLN